MVQTENGKDDGSLLRTVSRAFQLLEVFGREARPLSLRELAEAVGIDKSGAQRIAQTLVALGYLERAPESGRLVPGKRLLDRSFDYLRTNPLIERATPILLQLRDTTKERVDLSLFADTMTIYALRFQSKRETFFATLIGRRIPTFRSSGGRAMMAHLDDAEVLDILDRSERQPKTPKTITGIDMIVEKVAEARRDGHALALEESALGEVVLAAAIVNRKGQPQAAIHIASSLSEWTVEDFRKRFAPLAMEAARALSG